MPRILQIEKRGCNLGILLPENFACAEAALWIESDRNALISRYSDASSRNPRPEAMELRPFNRNICYPVVDIEPTPESWATFRVANVRHGNLTVNPMYGHGKVYPLESGWIEISGEAQVPWENWFCYTDPGMRPEGFAVVIPVPAEESDGIELKPLSNSWSGRIRLRERSAEGWTTLAEGRVAPDPKVQGNEIESQGDKDDEEGFLRASLKYIRRSIDRVSGGSFEGSAYLFYDYDARMFRQKNWFWTFGPTINALLRVGEMSGEGDRSESERDAVRLGELTLRHIRRDPGHPAEGIPLSRFDASFENDAGFEEKYSPSDSLFLASWGWLPLYRHTGDRRYLDAAVRLVEATGCIIRRFGLVPQDFYARAGCWNDWTMNEAGFGMEGIADVYAETGDSRHQEIGRLYIRQLLDVLEAEDGLWHRNFFHHSGKVLKNDWMTRGLGWAMEGLTAAWRMGLGDVYLEKAVRMAARLLEHQRGDGSWGYHLDRGPAPANPVSEKGTALWSVLFLRLHRMTGDDAYREAALRALCWCRRNQYRGPDPDGSGGIPVASAYAGVNFRPHFRLSCLYTVSFAVLAHLDARKAAG